MQGEPGRYCACARLLLERVPLARRRIVALSAARVRGSRGALRGHRGRLRRRQLPPGIPQLGRGGVGRREPGAQPRRLLLCGSGVRSRLRARPGPCFFQKIKVALPCPTTRTHQVARSARAPPRAARAPGRAVSAAAARSASAASCTAAASASARRRLTAACSRSTRARPSARSACHAPSRRRICAEPGVGLGYPAYMPRSSGLAESGPAVQSPAWGLHAGQRAAGH
jgi:hypothetical protein